MKTIILCALLLLPSYAFTQKKLKIIHANSKEAFIKEGNDEKESWFLSPEIRPDIYTLTKSPQKKRVRLYTDIDSIEISLKPGQNYDFVVILNKKDSCFTRFENAALLNFSKQQPEVHDTIPFYLTEYNNVVLKTIVDDKDTLKLKFDSGSNHFRITKTVLKSHAGIKQTGSHHFQIGNQHWFNQAIYPVEVSGHGTDGRFGWNLFDGKIVEIDYDKSLFIVHSKMPEIKSGYQPFELEYSHTLLCIKTKIMNKNKTYLYRFMLDHGYQRTVMLDDDLMREQSYPKDSMRVIKKVMMKNGQGEDVPVLTVNCEAILFGKYVLNNFPVQLMLAENPAGFKTHILGNEVLKRYNTFLDFQKHTLYLRPNRLYNLPYAEQ